MNNKEAIINKIIDNANKKAQGIIKEAEEKKNQILKEAEEKAKEYRNQHLPNRSDLVDLLVQRGEVLSNLEAKKIILSKKKQIIDEVFKLSIQDFKLKDSISSYKKLIETMIKNNAENGDIVQFAKDDQKIFDEKYLESLAKKLKLKLTINKVYGDFLGGVIITNKKCDKNLSIEIEIEELRSSLEASIAKIVFGDK